MRLLVGLSCLVLAAACSDDDKVRRLPDAPPPPDAEVDASPFGPVSLTILEGTTPRVGIRVIFQNADSTVVSDTTTGSDGKASAMMMPGGYVTAIQPFDVALGIAQTDIRTIAGVKPGDQLQLFQQPLAQTAITVNVVLPVENGAFDYRVSTNCMFGALLGTGGSAAQPMGTLQMAGCGATANLLVEALDANFLPISSIYKQSVALVDNGTIDLTADTYTAIPDVSFTYTNVPAGFSDVFVYAARATSLGKIFELNGGAIVDTGTSAATFTTKVPPIASASAITASTFSSAASLTQQMITEWGPVASPYTLDLGAQALLPSYDSTATLDVAAHAVKWTASGGTAQPDFVHVRAFLTREAPLMAWNWTLAAPAGMQVVLPVLPETQFNPIAGDISSFQVTAGKVPGGYDAVRAHVLAAPSFQDIAVGAAGKATFAFLVEGKPTFLKKPTTPSVHTNVLRRLRRR